jgi:hypothetical protein
VAACRKRSDYHEHYLACGDGVVQLSVFPSSFHVLLINDGFPGVTPIGRHTYLHLDHRLSQAGMERILEFVSCFPRVSLRNLLNRRDCRHMLVRERCLNPIPCLQLLYTRGQLSKLFGLDDQGMDELTVPALTPALNALDGIAMAQLHQLVAQAAEHIHVLPRLVIGAGVDDLYTKAH